MCRREAVIGFSFLIWVSEHFFFVNLWISFPRVIKLCSCQNHRQDFKSLGSNLAPHLLWGRLKNYHQFLKENESGANPVKKGHREEWHWKESHSDEDGYTCTGPGCALSKQKYNAKANTMIDNNISFSYGVSTSTFTSGDTALTPVPWKDSDKLSLPVPGCVVVEQLAEEVRNGEERR